MTEYIHVAAGNNTGDGWISVDDKLPEPYADIGCTLFSRNVLVFNGEDISINYVMYPHGIYGHDTTPRFSDGSYDKNNDITHWMSLPAPPIQE